MDQRNFFFFGKERVQATVGAAHGLRINKVWGNNSDFRKLTSVRFVYRAVRNSWEELYCYSDTS